MKGRRSNERVCVIARGVTKRYGSTVALRGIDLELRGGELTLIEGHNGSGKSTLLAILGKMVRPTSGTVTFEPQSVGEMLRARIGWVSHESLVYADWSGRKNVEFAAAMHGLGRSEAWQHVAERFELGPFAEKPVRHCSRGQRQRIALARALVHAPDVILLDEPTSGLDVKGTKQLKSVLEEELDRGAAVAMVVHGEGLFEGDGVRRVELRRGKVVASEERSATGDDAQADSR